MSHTITDVTGNALEKEPTSLFIGRGVILAPALGKALLPHLQGVQGAESDNPLEIVMPLTPTDMFDEACAAGKSETVQKLLTLMLLRGDQGLRYPMTEVGFAVHEKSRQQHYVERYNGVSVLLDAAARRALTDQQRSIMTRLQRAKVPIKRDPPTTRYVKLVKGATSGDQVSTIATVIRKTNVKHLGLTSARVMSQS